MTHRNFRSSCNKFILSRMENPAFSNADKCIYDYPAFLPERYSDQSVASQKLRTGSAANARGSTSAVMNTNNPLYVHEETLNSDYVNYK